MRDLLSGAREESGGDAGVNAGGGAAVVVFEGESANEQCENFHPGRPRRLSANPPPTLDYTLNCEEPLKYERVLGKTEHAKHYLEKLIDVVERWRNTYTHGGFEKGNETTVYAHVPGVGALPIGLSSMRGRSFLSLPNATDVTIRDVFSLFDEFDEWFATAVPQASAWIESGLDVRFDADFRVLVDSLAGDPERFQRYIDYSMYEVDQAANMDF